MNVKYTKLKNVATYPTGKLNSNEAELDGKYPFFTCAHEIYRINRYAYDGEYVLLGGNNANGDFPIFYYNGKFEAYQRTYLIQPIHKEKYDTHYLYYAIRLKLEMMKGNAAGTATKFLTQPILNNISIENWEIDYQKKIVEILSNYDLAIENNNKRIKILEQMAENIYKEWFVRFRFPGHEKTEFENGLPKGWKIEKLNKVFEIKYGKDHKGIEEGNIPILGSGGIMRYGNKAIYCGESVLIPRKGSLNNIMYMNGEFWTVDTMFYTKLLIDNIGRYAYYTLKNIDMESCNSGAALPSMTTNILYHLKIMIPDSKILSRFNDIVNLFYKKIDYLKATNSNLTKQRDLLLPRLMSGKLAC